jgi:hypothetical protein
VRFHGSDNAQLGTVIALWSVVSQVAGDLLEATSHVPNAIGCAPCPMAIDWRK